MAQKQKKEKKCKFDYIKLKNIFVKEHYQESERLCREWEKIYVNYISGDGPVPNIYKEFYNLMIKRQLNIGKIFEKYFLQKYIQRANNYMKICSKLVIGEIQINTTMWYSSHYWGLLQSKK